MIQEVLTILSCGEKYLNNKKTILQEYSNITESFEEEESIEFSFFSLKNTLR
jgi:hypothetical protein